ncbi:MAG TPA: hypothetical protein VLE72_01330 [Candidatus Saccharimonadales bacterium]|nr:hypothetical protein [Candidatus Saccharimonadales bacterium]
MDFENVLAANQMVRQAIQQRDEADQTLVLFIRSLKSIVGQLLQRVVKFDYNPDARTTGDKAQRFIENQWKFLRDQSAPTLAFVNGFGIDEAQGPYLEAIPVGKAETWRIFLDGLTNATIVDVENLQPQPG